MGTVAQDQYSWTGQFLVRRGLSVNCGLLMAQLNQLSLSTFVGASVKHQA